MTAAHMSIATAVEVSTTRLKQMACNINVVLREVFQTILETRQRNIRIRNLNLGQLADEPDVLDLGLKSVWVLLSKMVSKLVF